MKHRDNPFMVVAALTLFAVILILAQIARPWPRAIWLAVLVATLCVLPGASKVVAPLAAILTLAVGESLAGMRPD
jgi:hypothetical protein